MGSGRARTALAGGPPDRIPQKYCMEISEIQVDGYEKVIRCRDQPTGLHAIVAIHDTTLGPALGGMRMLPYVSEDEALYDVLRLAKGMTYKSAVADTGLGGGKAVILGEPAKIKSPALFQAMGRFIESFEGSYITAEDMNISVADLEDVRRSTRWVVGLSRAMGSSGNPSPYTARGCFMGMRAVLEEVCGSGDFTDRRILLQGVGAVGGDLAVRLKENGAHVIICDINEERVAQLVRGHCFEVAGHDGHVGIECDIYAPCARGAGINDRTIPKLRCKAIAGCANNQLEKSEHAAVLKERGILYAPDYVLNAGGIINVAQELQKEGYVEKRALKWIDGIYDQLKLVFEISRMKDIDTHEAAAHLAEVRLEQVREDQGKVARS